MDFIALIVFVIVQILFIPLTIVGLILVFYKQMHGSKKLGVSSTAIEAINGRWTMDVFGFEREDFMSECNYGGAAAFLEFAADADVSMFI